MLEWNYRERKKLRLRDYDYSKEGVYFITILVKNRENVFGNINGQKMVLNYQGKIAEQCWEEIPQHFKQISLYDYIIMPNHMHGLIEIRNTSYINIKNAYMHSLQDRTKMLISKVIQQYKAEVSRRLSKSNKIFSWHKSFYDHIVRNEEELIRIQEYIIYNPLKWNEDEYYKDLS